MSHSHSTTDSSDSSTTTPAATRDVVCVSTCHRQQQLDVRLQTETPGPASPDARRPGQTYCLGFATGRCRQSRRIFSTTTTVTRGTLAIVIVPRFLTSSSGDLKVSCPSLRFHIDDDFHSASSFASRIREHSACWTPRGLVRWCRTHVIPRQRGNVILVRSLRGERGGEQERSPVDPAQPPMRDDADGDKREEKMTMAECVCV